MITNPAEALAAHGIAPTPQRLAVYRAIAGNVTHPSVDEVFVGLRKRLPTLSKTTVYATLQLLAAKRLIGCAHLDGGEVRYDGVADFHAHFRCRTCGKVFDVKAAGAHAKPFVKTPAGFEIENEELAYYGRCPKCQKKKPTRKGK